MSHVKKIEAPTKFHQGLAFRKLKDNNDNYRTYREKRNRIINFFRGTIYGACSW